MVEKYNVAIVNVLNKNKKYAMNKDLNGGFGTADDYGDSLSSRVIKFLKRKSIRLPIIGLAFLQAILKDKGHKVSYFEGCLPSKKFDIILIYGTIVDHKNENNVCKLLKKKFNESIVGFIGPFPSMRPDLFDSGDFVMIGEAESFFMNEFNGMQQLKGKVRVKNPVELDKLPTPCYDGFPIKEYGYSPVINEKPFLVLQASKGCPYTCSFYCPYAAYQGSKVRERSAKKVVNDIVELKKRYGAKGVQFRDPVFGISKKFILELCNELKVRRVKIVWGMETRLDLLDEEILKKMFDSGLRNVNVGIETTDLEVAKKNKRKLISESHQDKIINICNKLGIKLTPFYILGYDGDTVKTVRNTIKYAIKLNTAVARFAISTPYPGTGFYDQLEKQGRLLTKDYEEYTQFNLVYGHDNISRKKMKSLLEEAFRRYYFRPRYFFMLLKWKIREFWL